MKTSFTFTGILRTHKVTKWPAPSGLIAQSVEHCTGINRRGHGFESCSGLNFFQALIS